MELSAYSPSDADQIEQLFISTFSDPEGFREHALSLAGPTLVLAGPW